MKDKLKNGLIIALIVIIGLFGFFGGKRVIKDRDVITTLKNEKKDLQEQNKALETQNNIIHEMNKQHQKTIDSCRTIFKQKDKIIAGLTSELDSALAKLDGITSDSSYQFLQQIAYKYPGLLKYLFNETQVRMIHADYLKARNAEKIIPEYKAQVANCVFQIAEKDKIEAGLNAIISNKNTQLSNCEQINKDNEQIIKNTEQERDAERRRKGFWRFTTSVATAAAVIVAVFL